MMCALSAIPVDAQPLSVRTRVVRISKHKIIRMLQQAAVAGHKGASMQWKYNKGKNLSPQNT